jgi:hypothetical protein
MATFIVRVELHEIKNLADDAYEKLHTSMEGKGFSRTIKASDGSVDHLPPAEYRYEGSATKDQVLDLAREAAKTVDKKFGVLVTEGSCRWWGLKEKTPAPKK